MTPQSVGLSGIVDHDRQAVRPERPREQARRARLRARGRGARRDLPPGDRARRREEGGHRRRPRRARRAARRRGPAGRPARGLERDLVPRRQGDRAWSRSSVGDEEHAKAAIGNGPVDALFEAVDAALQPVFGWHPVLEAYEIKAVSGGEDAQGRVLVRCRRSSDEGPGALIVVRPRVKHEHHRGLDRGVPRRGQQAPRRVDRAGVAGVRRVPDDGAPLGPVATYRIASIGGDGVGPEVVAAARDGPRRGRGARRVHDRVARRRRRRRGHRRLRHGPADRGPRRGRPAATRCSSARSAARAGTTRTRGSGRSRRCSRSAAASSCSRTSARSRSLPALVPSSPVRPEVLEGVDLLIVRELTSGLYFGRPSEQRDTPEGRVGIDTLWYTEAEIRRVVRLAFELARGRRGRLTSVDKANVLATSRLWRKVVDETKPDFPDVEVAHQLVDSCAMLLVRRPAAFDVLVTENLFGDILSDEAAVLAGQPRDAPVGVARRPADGARPVRAVRADPRLRAGHRRPGRGEPARRRSCPPRCCCAGRSASTSAADDVEAAVARGDRRRLPDGRPRCRPTAIATASRSSGRGR